MELSNPGKHYQVSGNIVHCCQYHVVFCSKWRRKVLTAPIAEHLRTLIDEKQGEFGYRLLGVDISVDHVHLLLEIPPEKSVCAVVGKIKAHTSHVLRGDHQELRTRIPTLWTRVSMITSVGNVGLGDLEAFLEEQRKR
ncbi:MAG: IS200/IS605 family transposase [Victivallales bacterium]|nr:IS200/IS605 family transposase [Victivallales bacterium]